MASVSWSSATSVLQLAPHIVFRFDETRQRWIMMAPERLMLPDEQAVEILQLVDGKASVDAIVDTLAARYTGAARGDRRATSPPCCRTSRTRDAWPMPARIDPPLGAARRADASLSAALPLLLQPGRARARRRASSSGEEWRRVLREAAALGVLQVHFSGGEPMARRDLAALIAEASGARPLQQSHHVGHAGRRARDRGLRRGRPAPCPAELPGHRRPRTTTASPAWPARMRAQDEASPPPCAPPACRSRSNMVVHRQNLDGIAEMIDMALSAGRAPARDRACAVLRLGARATAPRCCRAARQLDEATRIVEAARERLKGVLAIDYVVPDYHGVRPKACMNGWGRQFLNVTPSGTALPCHAAETMPGIDFPSVRDGSLADIWYRSRRLQPLPRHRLDARAVPRAATGARSTGAAAAARPSC